MGIAVEDGAATLIAHVESYSATPHPC